MAMAERTATTSWDGDLAHGRGTVNGASGALSELAVTWASRTERSDGRTSPEELIAAAHSSCFSMALSHGLTEAGHPPDHLDVRATVTLDLVDGSPTVTSSDLQVTGRVPGIDQFEFAKAATDAGQHCPVSRVLAGLEISVEAMLEE
jgi:osmotically inducible protein OsmC